jgi:hypothetical protein
VSPALVTRAGAPLGSGWADRGGGPRRGSSRGDLPEQHPHHSQQLFRAERLAQQKTLPEPVRKRIAPITGNEGEGDVLPRQRGRELIDRVPAEIGIHEGRIAASRGDELPCGFDRGAGPMTWHPASVRLVSISIDNKISSSMTRMPLSARSGITSGGSERLAKASVAGATLRSESSIRIGSEKGSAIWQRRPCSA